ncbi:MAG: thioesterase domain-containing protein [Nostocales cyanobacterium 94392]|nr:thioesterase domain-containing protein [Nostocales cyanobacterium 94392]
MKTQNKLSSWISCPKPNPRATLKLFCFPCAGGTTSPYSKWHKYLPEEIEINLIQLPGRSYQIEEPLFTNFLPLIKTVTSEIKPYLNKPFAFFGHSMGATLSFEITRQLRRENHQIPTHLFVAACPAPHSPIKEPFIHQLPETEFITELQNRYNAIPQSIVNNKELMQMFLPCLRADFTMIETYMYALEKPLDCPITVFGGLQDKAISMNNLEYWCVNTNDIFKLEMFTGDHFFLHHPQSYFLQSLSQKISDILSVNLPFNHKHKQIA